MEKLSDYISLEAVKLKSAQNPLLCVDRYKKCEKDGMTIIQYAIRPIKKVPFASVINYMGYFDNYKYFDTITGDYLGSTEQEAYKALSTAAELKIQKAEQARIEWNLKKFGRQNSIKNSSATRVEPIMEDKNESPKQKEDSASQNYSKILEEHSKFSDKLARGVLMIDIILFMILWLTLHPTTLDHSKIATLLLVFLGNTSAVMTILAGISGFENTFDHLRTHWIFESIRKQLKDIVSIKKSEDMQHHLRFIGQFVIVTTSIVILLFKIVRQPLNVVVGNPWIFVAGITFGCVLVMVHFANVVNNFKLWSFNSYFLGIVPSASLSLTFENPIVFMLGVKVGVLSGFMIGLLTLTAAVSLFILKVLPSLLKAGLKRALKNLKNSHKLRD